MVNIQILRSGFPDLKFFGNTFVALNLARYLPNGMLIANTTYGGLSLTDSIEWDLFAKNSMNFRMVHSPFGSQLQGYDIQGLRLEKIIGDCIEEEEVNVDFHFAERDSHEKTISHLPRLFRNKFKQFMHLHCSA